MSIIVKGMKMPATCTRCTLDAFGYCTAARRYSEGSTTHERASFCPLVELPERHGRLIDADALKDTLDYYIREAGWSEEINKALRWVKDEFIDSEQAIVEAEGE